ncbi:hypothetical protein [Powai lake megavirus]|uniref:Uncharacterized protein n=1 Tax=Powai lake megavirus TaxID=1842663 RepID=A0A160ERH9_9VIRU|nr:hypothetical protein QJ849_gp984 [Powai lake megavirus]ANB51146.1 hypothetical protein [Powai lake megavirus]
MEINEFIDFNNLAKINYKSIICRVPDQDYKEFSSYDKISLPNKSETLFLMEKAKNSFSEYAEIKGNFIKNKYINNTTNLQVYLSKDNQFYCVNFNCNTSDEFVYFTGIFEKGTGKYFTIIYYHDMYHGADLRLCSDNYIILDDIQFWDHKHIIKNDPLNIIIKLNKRFNKFYTNIQRKINDNIDGKTNYIYYDN